MYRLCSPLIVVALGLGPGACGGSDNNTNNNQDARSGIDGGADGATLDVGDRPDATVADAARDAVPPDALGGDLVAPEASVDAALPDGAGADAGPPDLAQPDGASDSAPPGDSAPADAIAADATSDQLTPCPAGQLRCNGACTDVAHHPSHCGACGAACATGEVCYGGACSLFCPAGLVTCEGGCVDPMVDLDHCGATDGCGESGQGTAGISCDKGKVCKNGLCVLRCGSGTPHACNGTCVNFQTDEAHCGGCTTGGADHACLPGQLCEAGACVCPTGEVLCNTKCIDPKINPIYCGATDGCGDGAGDDGETCAAGTVCSNGVCGQTCAAATPDVCAGGCVDFQTNVTHCGGCTTGGADYSCLAGQLCKAGKCECPTGQVLCNKACVDPKIDPTYCGATAGCGDGAGDDGETCAAGTVCNNGGCAQTCGGATPSACAGGCVDHQSNPAHCGGCTTGDDDFACETGQLCVSGSCECPTGLTLCGDACVNTLYNPTHCGDCSDKTGTDCATGTPTGALAACVAGSCAYACPPATADCNGDLALGTSGNGCETPLGDDSNCSACGDACAPSGDFSSIGQCISHGCQQVCAPGFDDCNGDGHCECEGSCGGATCSGKLYYQHSTGIGQTWWDDVPLNTHDEAQATKACNAFRASDARYGECKPHSASTTDCGTNVGVGTRIPGALFGKVWYYSGDKAGYYSLSGVSPCGATQTWY